MRDAFGNKLEIGDKVVYNLSGELAYGEVKSINKNNTGSKFTDAYDYTAHITRDKLSGGHGRYVSKLSKVRNANGIVRIKSVT